MQNLVEKLKKLTGLFRFEILFQPLLMLWTNRKWLLIDRKLTQLPPEVTLIQEFQWPLQLKNWFNMLYTSIRLTKNNAIFVGNFCKIMKFPKFCMMHCLLKTDKLDLFNAKWWPKLKTYVLKLTFTHFSYRSKMCHFTNLRPILQISFWGKQKF